MTTADLLTELKADIDEVYKAGAANNHKAFWDEYQKDWDKPLYATQLFSGYGWTDAIYHPTKPIPATAIVRMYQYSQISNTKVPIICGAKLEDGEFVSANGCDMANTFNSASNLETIKELVVNPKTTFTSTFGGCSKLKNITFTGTIQADINLSTTDYLSLASIKSVLKACNGNGSGKTIMFSSYCADGETDTFTAIITDSDMNQYYREAIDKYKYNFSFN